MTKNPLRYGNDELTRKELDMKESICDLYNDGYCELYSSYEEQAESEVFYPCYDTEEEMIECPIR